MKVSKPRPEQTAEALQRSLENTVLLCETFGKRELDEVTDQLILALEIAEYTDTQPAFLDNACTLQRDSDNNL